MSWIPEEDEKLLRLVSTYKTDDDILWGLVADWMPNHNEEQIIERYNTLMMDTKKGVRFTAEEDRVIMNWVQEHGECFRYFKMDLLPGRTKKSIRTRYMDSLRYANTHHTWNSTDDQKLLNYVAENTKDADLSKINWSECAKLCGKRSRTSCRARYYTNLKKKNSNHMKELVHKKVERKQSSSGGPSCSGYKAPVAESDTNTSLPEYENGDNLEDVVPDMDDSDDST